jgi:hypothetical protein
MPYASTLLAVAALVVLGSSALAHQVVDVIPVGGQVAKPGPYDRVEGECLAALINRIGGIPAFQDELERYRRGERISRVRINLYRDGRKRTLRLDPRSKELWELIVAKGDVIEIARVGPIEGLEESKDYSTAIILKKSQVEPQGSAGQPATRSASDSESNDKPQPKSEGRSR